jgi:cytochrome c-type biogenesis protein
VIAELMQTLGTALNASLPLALGASFIWGLMSMVLSPCHLVSVPLVMGYLQQDTDVKRLSQVKLALVFALGMTVSIGVIGLVTSLLGRIAGDIGTTGNIIMAAVLVYVGVAITGLVNLPLPGAGGRAGHRRKGMMGALVIGIVLGAALGPCTFAFMAPVLALMFTLGSQRLYEAVMLGLFFAAGHGIVVIVAGSYADRIQAFLKWSGESRTARFFRIVCGSLVVLGGVYLLYTTVLRYS